MVELFFIARLLSGLSAGEFHSLKTYPYLYKNTIFEIVPDLKLFNLIL